MDHPVIDRLDPASTALVVVDAQVAFASEESPIADRGVDLSGPIETVPRVADLIDVGREADLAIAYTRSMRRGDNRDGPERVHRILPEIYREGEPICRAGSPDAAYVEGVEPAPGEYEVEKRRYDGFHGTPLESYLRVEGVETTILCGFTTNVCVESTARGAHERGFDVVVAEDCCASFSPAMHESALRNAELVLGTTATAEQIAELLGDAS
ncbi:MAG TPA: isochorismatase family cysteine hydrolase [Halobacteriales archaeon]|nr:isochorismatase family cysteine hydrolase [Halobacteriales archaeon]